MKPGIHTGIMQWIIDFLAGLLLVLMGLVGVTFSLLLATGKFIIIRLFFKEVLAHGIELVGDFLVPFLAIVLGVLLLDKARQGRSKR